MRPRTRSRRESLTATIVAIVLAAGLASALAVAAGAEEGQPGDAPGEQTAERSEKEEALKAVRQDIEASRRAEQELAAEIEALRKDRAALNEQLIATAGRIQDIEGNIEAVEDRLAMLEEREDQLRQSFRGRSALLAELLGALQRMGRRPPPAVLVNPDDALKTVRTAILLGAVLPGLRIETEALASDLQEMARLKRQIETEKARFIAQNRDLDGERKRVAALIEAKQQSAQQSESELGEIREKARKLAEEAQNLEELIASIDREIELARSQAALTSRAPLTPRDALGALRNPSRLEPAIAFSDAKGLLPMPVNGAVVHGFGSPDDFGSAARGISVATRAQAQIIAPSDGWVVYAGPFRSYGQLLILNAGDGYHVLLAGMDKIAVSLGQFVLAGEPVGQMGGLVLASATNVTVGRSQPVLYIEFRKDGRSIDPAPWWAEGRTGVGG
ncbi:murein hydrolase activator EnvC family protein [Microbaculum marinum]|uniref:Peptidoglycan DD-metalloendopeptidase family protein n=1 Tax=Microbaculum marinum TaxID=1764581 RepID=A0AAW9RQS1_9HYPH